MLCVILRVWEKWAAVVDAKVICVSSRKDRAISLWKADDARLTGMPIDRFVFLTFLDRRVEVIRAEELVGLGKTYRTVMRSGARVSEDDKDEIARAMELVRSAGWAQLPAKFQAYEDTSRAWSKARTAYLRTAAATVTEKIAAKAAATFAAKAGRQGNALKAEAAKVRAVKFADSAKRLAQRANAARDSELSAAAALHIATAAHLESKPWELRELLAHRAQVAAAQARAERSRALRRGRKLDAGGEAEFAQLVEDAETRMRQLRDEENASRGFRSLGPVWRVFKM